MKDGSPIGRTTFIFYRDDNIDYVLGALAFGYNTGRTMFFPGLNAVHVTRRPDGKDLTEESDHIDHFTLDDDL